MNKEIDVTIVANLWKIVYYAKEMKVEVYKLDKKGYETLDETMQNMDVFNYLNVVYKTREIYGY